MYLGGDSQGVTRRDARRWKQGRHLAKGFADDAERNDPESQAAAHRFKHGRHLAKGLDGLGFSSSFRNYDYRKGEMAALEDEVGLGSWWTSIRDAINPLNITKSPLSPISRTSWFSPLNPRSPFNPAGGPLSPLLPRRWTRQGGPLDPLTVAVTIPTAGAFATIRPRLAGTIWQGVVKPALSTNAPTPAALPGLTQGTPIGGTPAPGSSQCPVGYTAGPWGPNGHLACRNAAGQVVPTIGSGTPAPSAQTQIWAFPNGQQITTPAGSTAVPNPDGSVTFYGPNGLVIATYWPQANGSWRTTPTLSQGTPLPAPVSAPTGGGGSSASPGGGGGVSPYGDGGSYVDPGFDPSQQFDPYAGANAPWTPDWSQGTPIGAGTNYFPDDGTMIVDDSGAVQQIAPEQDAQVRDFPVPVVTANTQDLTAPEDQADSIADDGSPVFEESEEEEGRSPHLITVRHGGTTETFDITPFTERGEAPEGSILGQTGIESVLAVAIPAVVSVVGTVIKLDQDRRAMHTQQDILNVQNQQSSFPSFPSFGQGSAPSAVAKTDSTDKAIKLAMYAIPALVIVALIAKRK